MSRIPEHIIDQVRAAVDVVELVGRRVELKKKGRRFWGRCPFHGDKDPSMTVDPASQRWHCYGCHAGGDIFDWVSRDTGASFIEAVRSLAGQAGIEVPKRQVSPEHQKKDDQAERLRAICAAAADFYHQQLDEPDCPGREYLRGRDLTDEDLALWGLGWAPDSWDALKAHLAEAGFSPEDGVAAGVLAESKGRIFDRFRGRVIIPIRDHAGWVVSLAGRSLGDGDPKYLNGPETAIFSKSRVLYNWPSARRAMHEKGRAIVVEGYFDAISMAINGFPETVAGMGTALTEDHAKALAKHTRRVIMALDGDEAGWKAAKRSLDALLPAGLMPLAMEFSDGRDPDEVVRQDGEEAVAALLAAAKPLLGRVLDDLKARQDLATVEGQCLFLDEAKPLLDRISDKIMAAGYIARLADELDLPKTEVKKRLSWTRSGQVRPLDAPPAPRKPGPASERDELQEMRDAADALAQYKAWSEFDQKQNYRPALLVHDILKKHRILSDTKTGLLYAWTGKYWRPIHRDEIKKIIMAMMGLAASRNRVDEALALVVGKTALPSGEEMDLAPELLCVENGMLDLDSGKLRPHDPNLRCTSLYPYEWTPHEPPDCPWFKRTLRECLDNPEVIDEVLEFIAYCLLHRQTYKKALLLVGPKDCGKSLLQEIIRQLIGPDNCSAVDMRDLEDQFQRVALHRRRANICGEVSANFFSSKAFMRLTGGDPLQAAYKGYDTFTFDCAAKLIFSSNEFPRVRESSDAFYGRMLAVNFPRQFILGQPGTDTARERRIVPTELPGIFHLAVARLYYLRRRGAFSQCAASKAFLNQYRLENDNVAQFLAERCITERSDGVIPEGRKESVYEAYKRWCESNGIPKPKRQFEFWKSAKQAYPHIELKDHGPTQDGERPPWVVGLHLVEVTQTAA